MRNDFIKILTNSDGRFINYKYYVYIVVDYYSSVSVDAIEELFDSHTLVWAMMSDLGLVLLKPKYILRASAQFILGKADRYLEECGVISV
jgi:hypothetical protein